MADRQQRSTRAARAVNYNEIDYGMVVGAMLTLT